MMKAHKTQFTACLTIVLALLAATPLWANQRSHGLLRRILRPEYPGYLGLLECGGGFSQQYAFISVKGISRGIYWPRPFGMEGSLVNVVDYVGQEETVLALLPVGVYFPILRLISYGGDSSLLSIMNLSIRAYLFNGEIYHLERFPPVFDICVEWRSYFHSITVGYRRQSRHFEHGTERFDTSGLFIAIHAGLEWVTDEI